MPSLTDTETLKLDGHCNTQGHQTSKILVRNERSYIPSDQ